MSLKPVAETFVYATVAVHRHDDPSITTLKLQTLDGLFETITTTPEHPFYVTVKAGNGLRPRPLGHEDLNERWVGAGHLVTGDKLKLADGREGSVVNVTTHQRTQEMFNLTVDTAHTFFVGTQGWLVHNCEVTVDIRKFSDYVLDPAKGKGKHVIFNSLGYYNTADDSKALKDIFYEQGLRKIKSGDYESIGDNGYDLVIRVAIDVPGQKDAAGKSKTILSGWMIDSEGSIKLTTPMAAR